MYLRDEFVDNANQFISLNSHIFLMLYFKLQANSVHCGNNTSTDCKFSSHLIYFQFLKLKICDKKTKYVPPFCTEWFVNRNILSAISQKLVTQVFEQKL